MIPKPTSTGAPRSRRLAHLQVACSVAVLTDAVLSRNAGAQSADEPAPCYGSLEGSIPRRSVQRLAGSVQRLDVDLDGDRRPEHVELSAGRGNSVSLTIQQGAETRRLGNDVTRRLAVGESIACAMLNAADLTHDGTPDLIVFANVDGGDIPREVIHVWNFAPRHLHSTAADSHGPFEHTEFLGTDRNVFRRGGTIRAVIGGQGRFRDLIYRGDRFYLFNTLGGADGFAENGPLAELPEPPVRPARRR